MHQEPMEPTGVTLTGMSLVDLDSGDVSHLRDLLAHHGVLVMPDQDIDDAEFMTFLQQFGALSFTTGETAPADFPELNVVSNVGRTRTPRSTFHVDTSYVQHPPAYTALRAVTIPAEGGETLFTSQYRAFETLPPDVREQLQGRTINHVVTGLTLGDDDETSAQHPVFQVHPISGRTTLYMSTPERCASISGMSAKESEQMVMFLFDHSTAEHNIYRHSWAPGDVVMWDNLCVLHRADHAQVVGDRVMHRGMVATYGPS